MLRILAILVALAGCSPGRPLVMPAPEFDHPFNGELVEHQLPYFSGRVWSRADRNFLLDGWRGKARCDISLWPGLNETDRAQLRRVEIGNCNAMGRPGFHDVNDHRSET
jgi:hypothetical protein